MDTNDEIQGTGKNKNKRNIFQRGSGTSNKIGMPEEIGRHHTEQQNVSVVTPENDLSCQTSAIQQYTLSMTHISDQQCRSRSHSNASSNATDPELSLLYDNKDSLQVSNSDMTALDARKSTPPIVVHSDIVPTAGQVLFASTPSPSTVSITETDSVTQYDAVDGVSTSDLQRNRQIAESLKQKIMKTSEAFKAEQAIKDGNVTEYLQLSANADKQQKARIKAVFEKKNSKSNSILAQYQKKLDTYHKKLRELENGSGKQGIFRDVGANLRGFSGGVVGSVKEGLSGLQHKTQNAAGAIVNKPKEMASKLKSKFGSFENLAAMKDVDDHKSKEDTTNTYNNMPIGSADDASSNSGSVDTSLASEVLYHEETRYSLNSPRIQRTRDTQSDTDAIMTVLANELPTIRTELKKIKADQEKFGEMWEMKKQQLHSLFTRQLEEERVKYDDQLNDLNEFHRREMACLKQELTGIEEKLQYHANERARDMQEALERCQTRIAKMELQQHQQSVSVESLENASARALLGKLINLLLSVMAVLLVLVSALSGFLMPFIKSQGRVFVTVLVVLVSVFVYRHWDLFT